MILNNLFSISFFNFKFLFLNDFAFLIAEELKSEGQYVLRDEKLGDIINYFHI